MTTAAADPLDRVLRALVVVLALLATALARTARMTAFPLGALPWPTTGHRSWTIGT